MNSQRKRVRIEQTGEELDRLQGELDDWFEKRKRADKLQQYLTQRNALKTALNNALQRLRTEIGNLSTQQLSTGELYMTCRAHEKRLLTVRRAWAYFRDKFDQRDNSTLKPVLAAADEIVWSCYAEVFQNAPWYDENVTQGSAPLPYIDPSFSPRAIPRTEASSTLRSVDDRPFLSKFFAQLPLPVISLPPICIQAPWWLIYLGHEVGHHIQHDLGLTNNFGQLLKSTAKNPPAPQCNNEQAQRWYDWHFEIFADVFSILMMGPWALWAIAELEWGNERQLLRDLPKYPAPVVRLELMACLAEELGTDGQAGLGPFRPQQLLTGPPVDFYGEDLRQVVAHDLAVVPQMVKAMRMQPLVGEATFEDLCDWNANSFQPGGKVNQWARDLLAIRKPQPQRQLSAARQIISGAFSAWAREVSTITDDQQRQEKRARLLENLLPTLAESREDSTRSSTESPEQDAASIGRELAQSLLEIGLDEMETW